MRRVPFAEVLPEGRPVFSMLKEANDYPRWRGFTHHITKAQTRTLLYRRCPVFWPSNILKRCMFSALAISSLTSHTATGARIVDEFRATIIHSRWPVMLFCCSACHGSSLSFARWRTHLLERTAQFRRTSHVHHRCRRRRGTPMGTTANLAKWTPDMNIMNRIE